MVAANRYHPVTLGAMIAGVTGYLVNIGKCYWVLPCVTGNLVTLGNAGNMLLSVTGTR